jgi:RND superfamily putative drug exporter
MVIVGWVGLAIVLRSIAPPWEAIAADGDLAFLPATVPSAIGQQTLVASFPAMRSRSQMVMVFAKPGGRTVSSNLAESELTPGDLALAMDIGRRLHWSAAKNAWQALQNVNGEQSKSADDARVLDKVTPQHTVYVELIIDNLTQAIEIEEILAPYLQNALPEIPFLRLPDAYQMRGELLKAQVDLEQPGVTPTLPAGQNAAQLSSAALDLDTAALMREQNTPTLPNELPVWATNIQDVWSWRHPIVGHKLGANEPAARLINLELSSDFTATGNIETLGGLEQLARDLRPQYAKLLSTDLAIEVTGSGAIGADMLRAAASGVKQTEIVTIVLVLSILAFVYRAPFLVAIPLASIALSLIVSTSLIALLARDPTSATSDSFGLGVFTTTRVFIVVLLFGAGTDFCLFLLARTREICQLRPSGSRRQMLRVIAKGWRSVHDALVASALTTVVGLALMWFSNFEKFQFSGPIIAISLWVTLCVCLTFTPALLSGLGRLAFWPQLRTRNQHATLAATPISSRESSATLRYWSHLAAFVVGRPGLAMLLTLIALGIPAVYGMWRMGNVTYDLTEELSASSPSRRGARLISQYFPTLDGSPITVLVTRTQPFETEEDLREACDELSAALYTTGVESVRSLTDPLGDYPPGKRMGLFDKDAWRRRLLNRIAQERYVSTVDDLKQRVAKFDVVLKDNPFSLEAGATLTRINEVLQQQIEDAASAWRNASYATAGTTVGITDLRRITQGDQTRIQILVTLGVWLVLVIMLRGWILPAYLMFTVLLSYFATLGITYAVFATLYAPDYSGLDWKVPIFLFVILVAVGQDYNVYLVTRINEEQCGVGGIRDSVARALQATGGIITSCGFVMAGTFIAMASPAATLWLSGIVPYGWIDPNMPVLRGITELGFALASGVLLDTMVVRSILVPSFIVLRNQSLRHNS